MKPAARNAPPTLRAAYPHLSSILGNEGLTLQRRRTLSELLRKDTRSCRKALPLTTPTPAPTFHFMREFLPGQRRVTPRRIVTSLIVPLLALAPVACWGQDQVRP